MNKQDVVSIKLIIPNPSQLADTRNEAKVLEIAESLKLNRDNGTKGLLQVPTARHVNGSYELAFGHHRLYAFSLLAEQGDSFFEEMPLIVRDLSDQQMFELMAIENFKRRDIGPIEKAKTIHSYMTKFNKSSVEAGAFFQMSEEAIRGSIYLLQLPAPAQEKLDKGEITITTGRQLVTVSKLLGEEGVEDALEEMESEIFDSPQDAIEQVLSMAEGLVARLDSRAGWFSVKPFPSKHLAPITKNLIEKALEVDENTPPEVKAEIKELVRILQAGMDLVDENFPNIRKLDPHAGPTLGQARAAGSLEKVRVLALPPACERCSFHAVLDGDHYCGLVHCRTRKVEGWERKERDDFAKKLGIKLYVNAKDDGQYAELNTRSDADQKLFKSRHEDLRLIPAQYMWNNFDGVGRDMKVVVVGKTAEKRLKAQQEQLEKGQTENLDRELQVKVHHLKDQFIDRFQWEVAARAFSSALDGITNIKLLEFLIEDGIDIYQADLPEGSDDTEELMKQALKMKKADGLKELRRLIMVNMVAVKNFRNFRRQLLLDSRKTVIEFAKKCEKIAAEWDVKLPRDWQKQAETYQAELDAALKELKVPAQKVKA